VVKVYAQVNISIGGEFGNLLIKYLFFYQGKALEGYYRKQQKLLDFQVAGGSGETWQGLLAALHLKHLSAVSSSPKLAA